MWNQSVNMAEVIEVEIERGSEQEQRGREDEVVSVLSRLRPPVASDLHVSKKYGGTYIFKLLD